MDTTPDTSHGSHEPTLARRIFRGGTLLIAGHAGARALGLIRLMILARLLGPEQFGLASLLIICLLMLEMMSNLSFDKAMIRADDARARSLQSSAHLLAFVRGTLIALVMLTLASPLAALIGAPGAEWMIRWLALAPFLTGLAHLEPKRIQREMRYVPDVKVELVAHAVVTLAAWPVASSIGDASAVVWLIVGRCLLQALGSHLVSEGPYRWSLDAERVRHLVAFGLPLIVNGILMFVILQGDQVLVGRVFGLDTLGVYAAIYGLIAAPVLLIGKISTSLLLPVYAASRRVGDTFQRTHRFAAHGMGLIAVILMGGAIAVGEEVITLVYGTAYSPGFWLVAAVGVMQGIRLLRVAPSIASLAIGDTTNMMYANLVRAMALPAAMWAALSGSPVFIVALCGAMGEVVALIVMLARLASRNHLTPAFDARVSAMAALSTGAVLASAVALRDGTHTPVASLVPLGALALIVGLLLHVAVEGPPASARTCSAPSCVCSREARGRVLHLLDSKRRSSENIRALTVGAQGDVPGRVPARRAQAAMSPSAASVSSDATTRSEASCRWSRECSGTRRGPRDITPGCAVSVLSSARARCDKDVEDFAIVAGNPAKMKESNRKARGRRSSSELDVASAPSAPRPLTQTRWHDAPEGPQRRRRVESRDGLRRRRDGAPQLNMVDTEREGRRPMLREGVAASDLPRETMAVCPGVELTRDRAAVPDGHDPELLEAWGPILELWEGHAADEEIRLRGSSGGIATALALYCMEREAMAGTLHIRAREDAPVFNETVLSKTRADLLASTGSRYAPASPCEGLGLIEAEDDPCVFIGKPCDVAAVQKARKLRPTLDEKIGLTIAFFCAGTPTTRGTHELLRRMGIDDPSSVRDFRYRGNGWPGEATAIVQTPDGPVEKTLTYEQSWGEILSNHKQWRCNLCADHTGEFADIAVADAWHRPTEGDAGRSLVLVRTKRGREILRGAIDSGYVALEPASGGDLEEAQSYLIRTRGQVWGRVAALRSIGAPFPRFPGFRDVQRLADAPHDR